MNTTTPEYVANELRQEAERLKTTALTTKAIKQCRLAILADIRDHFNTSTGPDGAPWSPLKFARPNSRGADKPLLNNGLLRASLVNSGANHVEELTDHSLSIGTNLKYAGLHQEGGTVTPKNAKALTIPLTKEASRYKARDFPRPLALLWRKGAKSGVLAETKAKGKQTVKPQYALVKSVTVPARPFLGFGAKLVERLETIIHRVFGGKSGNDQNGSE